MIRTNDENGLRVGMTCNKAQVPVGVTFITMNEGRLHMIKAADSNLHGGYKKRKNLFHGICKIILGQV